MLAQESVHKFGDRARFVVEDFGNSPLAERFGVDKYPAIFVDDALVARPEDFYEWGGPGTGKYVPWRNLENRKKFQDDLERMLQIRLAGGEVKGVAPAKSETAQILPAVDMVGLDGKKFSFAEMSGQPVIVEFWATWCPICIETLKWMKTSLAPNARVVAVAVDSEQKDIDAIIKAIQPNAKIVIASPELRRAFSGPPAVPTLLIADSKGRVVKVFYGAPPDLHKQIAREVAKLN